MLPAVRALNSLTIVMGQHFWYLVGGGLAAQELKITCMQALQNHKEESNILIENILH
jgi:hypothetical protein